MGDQGESSALKTEEAGSSSSSRNDSPEKSRSNTGQGKREWTRSDRRGQGWAGGGGKNNDQKKEEGKREGQDDKRRPEPRFPRKKENEKVVPKNMKSEQGSEKKNEKEGPANANAKGDGRDVGRGSPSKSYRDSRPQRGARRGVETAEKTGITSSNKTPDSKSCESTTGENEGQGDLESAEQLKGAAELLALFQGEGAGKGPKADVIQTAADLEAQWQREEEAKAKTEGGRKREDEKRKKAEDERRKEEERRKRRDEEKKREEEKRKKREEERKKKEEERKKKEEELKKKKEEDRKKREEERRKKEEEDKRKVEERKIKEEEEKAREEERKRKEEERKAREEEERKQREEEELQRMIEEEQRLVQEYLDESRRSSEIRTFLRDKNLNAAENRPSDSFFTKLDSNLKKNTAFVKKLRNITEAQKDVLSKDFESLNLTKYIGEAAVSVTEAKLKMSDVACAVHLCSLLHQRYADFSSILLDNFQKILLSKKDEKISNPSKYRVDLRFFFFFLAVGVFTEKEGLPLLSTQLSVLINTDKEEFNNLSILISFCKHCGEGYAGLISRRIRFLAEKYGKELVRYNVLPVERQKACRNLLKEYYNALSKHLLSEHKQLKDMEKMNRKILQTKGELSNERQEKYESTVTAYQKLFANTSTYSDLLDEDIPDLPEEDQRADDDSMGLDIFSPMKPGEYQYEGDTTLFEDEDTRAFYETLSDLRALIPGILYKDSEQATTVPEEEEIALADDLEALNIEDVEKELEEAGKKQESKSGTSEEVKKEGEKEEEIAADELLDVEDDHDEVDAGTKKLILEGFLQSLPTLVNRDLIDKSAMDFCMNLNTKNNRKKLVRALFTVHRTRYDLLPFYSRLVAVLHPCMPDVATDLASFLKGDFKWHVRKKDQINIESKLKTIRFIGELVKFKMFSKAEALHCLKMLLFDFSHHNIEMACALLDTCGRYLYRSPDSHHRTKVYLDVMMRKKTALTMDSRYTTMIENAYYYSNPPDLPQMVKVERPAWQEYIRKLLYKDLSKTTTEKVLRQARKLNWDDPEVSSYMTKCIIHVWNMRYNNIHCAANLLAGLAPYHEEVAIHVVDGALEDIRIGMEINHPKFNQRRVSMVKFLGELYNYRMVESAVIFKTLYTFITFAVTLDDNAQNILDQPEHLFRVRLVCVLLDVCGQYFDRGSSKKKMDCFLVYFQRYYWFKRQASIWNEERPFPMDVEYLYRDTLDSLRPKLKLCTSFEQAQEAVDDLEKDIREKLASILPIQETDDQTESETEDRGLHSIKEADESVEELSLSLSQARLGEDYSSTAESEEDRTPAGHISQSQEESEGEGQRRSDMDTGEEETMESAGEFDHEEEEEEEVHFIRTGDSRTVKCQEDDDFMTEFDRMIADTVQARSKESVKVPTLDIAVPMHLKGQTRGKWGPGVSTMDESSGTINFTLMTKKGNKQQFASLHVPISAELAAKFKERAQAERAEKEKLKQMTLDIQERQEDEEYQEMIVNLNRTVMPPNTNRERRVRYQHPKGAPDADLIFGTKKR